MSDPPRHHRALFAAAFFIVALAMVPLRDAVRWYGRPFAGILIDPDGLVSNFGLPSWDGFRQGLHYPDQIVSVDGRLLAAAGRAYRGAGWDPAVEEDATA